MGIAVQKLPFLPIEDSCHFEDPVRYLEWSLEDKDVVMGKGANPGAMSNSMVQA